MEEINSKDRISRAKIRLLETNPFFAYLVSNMIINENNNMLIKSIAVDFNGNLHYDSSFIKQLSDSQLRTILCHEVLHLVFNHLERRSSRNPIVWNIGVDIIVNDLLLSNGFEFSGILAKNSPTYNHSFEIPQYNIKIENINEKTSEMIYSELYEQLKDFEKRQSSSGNGSGNPQNTLNRRRFDTHNFGDDKNKERKQLTQQEIEKVKEEWKKKIVSAMVYAKQRGTTPLGIDRYIDELLNQKINWKQLLYRYITNEIMTDYSYCLDKNSQILTINGTKKLKNIKINDKILGYDDYKILETKVRKIFRKNINKKYIIYTKNGNRIICSENHHFLTEKGFIKAKDLNISNILISYKNANGKIQKKKRAYRKINKNNIRSKKK